MTKPVIVTRSSKGSALTWTEGDSNFTNLQNATLTFTDGTNSHAFSLNDTVTFTAGSNVTLSVNTSTGTVTINSSNPGGTVTSVSGTGTVSGITLSGTVTSSGSLTLGGTLSLISPGAIGSTTASTGKFTNLTTTGYYNEAVYTGGTTTGTITPDCANGTTQKITLTGSITWNAFANAVAGQSMTMIITQPASGGPYTLTSTTPKWAGASKTLSTAANAVDIVTMFYDGSTYWASLSKGFA